jgi:very-short-patch-repair endonuclease
MFKDDENLKKIIEQEWMRGDNLDLISASHPEYSKTTYKRFLRGKKRCSIWTEEKRKLQSEASKKSWENRDQESKDKHIKHLSNLSSSQKGVSITLSESHKENIRKHLSSDKMKKILSQSNKNRKKYTEDVILKRASDYGLTIIGDLSNSDNSVRLIWPDGEERHIAIKVFMKREPKHPIGQQTKKNLAKEKWESIGLSVVLLSNNMAKVSYKGDTWTQSWPGCPNHTTKKRMIIADKASKIVDLIHSGVNLTSACKQVGVDPTTFARRLKLTQDAYQSVVTSRKYEQVLNVEGAIYNNRLPGFMIRPDIRVEDKKLIIEVDGLYWHTEQHKKRSYHHERAKLYASLGYKLLVFSQWEIEHKRHIVDSMISNKLGNIQHKIGARKCSVVELETKKANEFFEANHLKGSGLGKTIALVYEGDVVCAIRFHKCKEGINISRFCSKVNWTVSGGYSKLLTLIPNENIINFVDRRHGNGDHLVNYGFTKIHEHIGFEWTTGYESFNRRKFAGSSGIDHGMSRYWDYGQIKFIKPKQ